MLAEFVIFTFRHDLWNLNGFAITDLIKILTVLDKNKGTTNFVIPFNLEKNRSNFLKLLKQNDLFLQYP